MRAVGSFGLLWADLRQFRIEEQESRQSKFPVTKDLRQSAYPEKWAELSLGPIPWL
jgi:hypothetical protein